MTEINVRELVQLAEVLAENVAEAEPQMAAIVTRGALNVKRGWRDNAKASSGRHARHYPFTISYDVTPIPGGATAEVGPDKARTAQQATFGAILEFGSRNNPPHNDGGRALIAEGPAFEAYVADLAERLGPA